MENELIFLGLTALTPVYGALWYLIILGTKNKSKIDEIEFDLAELKNRFNKYITSYQGQVIET